MWGWVKTDQMPYLRGWTSILHYFTCCMYYDFGDSLGSMATFPPTGHHEGRVGKFDRVQLVVGKPPDVSKLILQLSCDVPSFEPHEANWPNYVALVSGGSGSIYQAFLERTIWLSHLELTSEQTSNFWRISRHPLRPTVLWWKRVWTVGSPTNWLGIWDEGDYEETVTEVQHIQIWYT